MAQTQRPQGVTRRRLLGGAVAGGAAIATAGATGASPATAATPRRPGRPANMIIFISDQHSAFVTSVMGHPLVQTPNIARLAARGTVYQNAYCSSPVCLPSRTSFLTGLPVHQTQVYDNDLSITPPDFPNFGSVLADQGLYSAYFGRIDSYRPFDEMGFSEIHARGYRDPYINYIVDKQPVKIRRSTPVPILNTPSDPPPPSGSRPGWPAVVTDIENAIDWIVTTGRNLETPWLLLVGTMPPHNPYEATRDLLDLYPDDDVSPYGRDEQSAQHTYSLDLDRHFGFTRYDPLAGKYRQGYYGSVTYVDQQLGRVMDAVDTAGLTDDTVITYTADHGDMLGKFGLWEKYVLFENAARVPLIIAGPGYDRGQRVTTPVAHWDLQASIFETLGATRPDGWLGEPLQRIPSHDPGRPAFSENHSQGTRGSSFLVRHGDWKLIWCQRAPHQLFHLPSDPHELRNLATEYPQRVRELTALLSHQFADPEKESVRADSHIARQIEVLRQMGANVI